MNKLAKYSFFASLLFSVACNPVNRYEKSFAMDSDGWKANDTLTFEFQPADTSKFYSESILIRHTNLYGYNNMWVGRLIFQNDSLTLRDSIELKLASNQENDWSGSCINDICELALPISYNNKLKENTYKVQLIQINREDPLKHILSLGYRVQPQ